MNRFVRLTFICLFFFPAVHAYDLVMEVKAGYFYPSNSATRRLVDDGGYFIGYEAFGGIWGNWKGFFAVDYFHKDSDSTGDKENTSVLIVPLSAGVRYDFCPFSCWNPYLAAGPTYHTMRIKDSSPNGGRRTTKKHTFGATGKMGIFIQPYRCLVIDLFCDFTYDKMSFDDKEYEWESRQDIYLSGVRGGVGIGWNF